MILIATALGVASGLAAVNVRYRDVRYVVPFLVQMWLFVTPIAYPSSLIGRALADALGRQPDGRRGRRLSLGAFSATSTRPLALIAVSAASALVFLVAGLAYFDRVERSFADLI